MTTGQRIADLRKSHSWTQPMFSEMMNVSQSTVTSWENDRRAVSNDDLKKMADIFHVSSDYLLCLTDIKAPKGTDEELTENQKLVAYSIDPSISAEERDAIIKMVEAAKAFKKRI